MNTVSIIHYFWDNVEDLMCKNILIVCTVTQQQLNLKPHFTTYTTYNTFQTFCCDMKCYTKVLIKKIMMTLTNLLYIVREKITNIKNENTGTVIA